MHRLKLWFKKQQQQIAKVPKRLPKLGVFANDRPRLAAAIVVFAVIGVYFIIQSFAAATTANLQAEDGTNDGATAGIDATASNGGFIQFGAGSADGIYNDDDLTRITYAGTWTPVTGDPAKYQGDEHYSQTTGSTATFSFSGTQVSVYGAKDVHHGIAGITIDNATEVPADAYNASRSDNALLFRSATLTAGNHSIKIRVTGTNNTASTGFVIALDRFVVGNDTTPDPPPLPPPPPPSTGGDPINNTTSFHAGYVFTDYSFDAFGCGGACSTGNARTAIENALKAEPWLMATHTYGFGVWTVAPGNWTDLDRRINLISSLNGIPMIYLCCSPDAYSTNPGNIEAKPKPENFDELAHDYALIAKRYSNVKYFVVWNEMKGFWNLAENRWDYEGYTDFYNQVYNAIKAVRPDAQIGGPYPTLSVWNPPPGNAGPGLTGIWGAIDQRNLDSIQYWLSHKAGAQFVAVDGGCGIDQKQGGGYPPGVTTMQANACFTGMAQWLRARSPLPIWWMETYANPSPGDENYKRDVFIDAFNKFKSGGGNVAIFWGSECYSYPASYIFGSMWNCSTGSTFPLFDAVKNGYN